MESATREIVLTASDGWTLYGTLEVPLAAKDGSPVPAVLLLHGPDHDRDIFASFVYPGLSQLLVGRGIAALRIDCRGRGQSLTDPAGNGSEYHSFTTEQKAAIGNDVIASLEFLRQQPEIDPDRIGVFAEEEAAEWAVTGTDRDASVKAIALLSGRLPDEGQIMLESNPDLPLMCAVSKEDRRGLADMSRAFAGNRNGSSELKLYENLGKGMAMCTLWRYRYPDERGVQFLSRVQGVDTEKIGLVPVDPGNEKPVEEVICNWLATRLDESDADPAIGKQIADGTALAGSDWSADEVSFKSEDGWTIYGTLVVPNERAAGRVPGIVLLHSGAGDRHGFHGLQSLFAGAGIVVLNIDWRGRGKSRGKGRFFDLSKDERENAFLDARAAINYLAAQETVDSNRIAVLGSYLGARMAVTAALGDSRVRALVMLSGYIPSGKERAAIAESDIPMLFIGSRGFGAVTNAMADLQEVTAGRGSELLLYEGGWLGVQLLEADKALGRKVADWVKNRLTSEKLVIDIR